MAILKFQPNISERLWLTRPDGIPAPSQFDDVGQQWQWKAKNQKAEPLTFYAGPELNEKLVELVSRTQNILECEIEICKRVFNKKAQWVVQLMNTPQHATPAAAAPTPTPATTTAPETSTAPETPKTSNVRRMTALYMQCFLEVRNAMRKLNGDGLHGEELRQATTNVFIACTQKNYTPNVERINELMIEFKTHQTKTPAAAPKSNPAQEQEFKKLMQEIVDGKHEHPERTYEPDGEARAASEQDDTQNNGWPKISEIKLGGLRKAAENKHVSEATLLSTIKTQLKLELKNLADLPDRYFSQVCTILSKCADKM